MTLTNGEPSNASRPSVSYGHFLSLYDYRHFPHTAGIVKHFFKVFAIRFNVYILSIFPVRRPGIVRVRSTSLAINDHLLRHD